MKIGETMKSTISILFFGRSNRTELVEYNYILNDVLPKNSDKLIRFVPHTDLGNINKTDVLVYSCRDPNNYPWGFMPTFEQVLEVVNKTKPTIIIQLSDEFIFEDLQIHNTLGNYCKLFLRQHHHPNYQYTNNTIHLPLAYCNDTEVVNKNILKVNDRSCNWSFFGEIKSDRFEMIENFKTINNYLIGSGITRSYMTDIYLNSIFVPSGRGNSSINCFRLYEASMSGAIPIVVGSKEELDMTFKYEENPPWIFSDSWNNAVEICKELLKDLDKLQEMQDNLLFWWNNRIGKIQEKVNEVLISKTLPIKVVQVGTNKGYDDLSRHLISNYDSLEFALFVEPNQLHLQDIKNCYQKFDNAIIENVAIKTVSDPNEEMTIYYHIDDAPDYQIASTDLNHILKHRHLYHDEGKIKSFTVPCLTLHELFEKYNIIELDWLLLDIEGLDAEILLTTDWKPYKIRRIEFEQLHLGGYKSAIYNMFIELGYKQVKSLHEYDWAFEKDNIDFKDINQKLEDFPSINFISIEESEDRRKFLYRQFEEYGLTNITPHIYKRYNDDDHKIIEGPLKLHSSGRGPVTSHLKAIKEWYQNTDEPYTFFCEDDLSFESVRYWNFTWSEFFSRLPSDWSCIQLCLVREEMFLFSDYGSGPGEIRMRSRYYDDWSGCAYLISRRHAKNLIENYYPNDSIILEYKGIDIEARTEQQNSYYFILPQIENLIYSYFVKGDHGHQIYSFPLFLENTNMFESTWSDRFDNNINELSYFQIQEWWKNTGKDMKLEQLIRL